MGNNSLKVEASHPHHRRLQAKEVCGRPRLKRCMACFKACRGPQSVQRKKPMGSSVSLKWLIL